MMSSPVNWKYTFRIEAQFLKDIPRNFAITQVMLNSGLSTPGYTVILANLTGVNGQITISRTGQSTWIREQGYSLRLRWNNHQVVQMVQQGRRICPLVPTEDQQIALLDWNRRWTIAAMSITLFPRPKEKRQPLTMRELTLNSSPDDWMTFVTPAIAKQQQSVAKDRYAGVVRLKAGQITITPVQTYPTQNHNSGDPDS